MNNKKPSQKAFVLLTSMFIVSAIGIAIAISLLLLGTNASKTSLALDQGKEARSLADLCAEEALERLRLDSAYMGTQIIFAGNGSCSYLIIDSGGENRMIQATGSVDTITQKVEVLTDQLEPEINITSWQDKADF